MNTSMMDFSEYPKTVELRDGSKVKLRPCRSADRDGLFQFFSTLDARDRRFFKHDVSRRETIDNWCDNLDYDLTLPILALRKDGGQTKVVGNGTLHANRHGWSTHVARVRAQVAPEMRGLGLGQILLRELCDRANQRGIDKVQAHLRRDNKDGARLIRRIGFRKEGVFLKHARDSEGVLHDVVVYFQDLEDLWTKMADLNLDLDGPSNWP